MVLYVEDQKELFSITKDRDYPPQSFSQQYDVTFKIRKNIICNQYNQLYPSEYLIEWEEIPRIKVDIAGQKKRILKRKHLFHRIILSEEEFLNLKQSLEAIS